MFVYCLLLINPENDFVGFRVADCSFRFIFLSLSFPCHGFFLYSSYLLLKTRTVEDSLMSDGIKFHCLSTILRVQLYLI